MSSKLLLTAALTAALCSCKKEEKRYTPTGGANTASTAKSSDGESSVPNDVIQFQLGKEGTRIRVMRKNRSSEDDTLYLRLTEDTEKGEKEVVLLEKEPLYREGSGNVYLSGRNRPLGFADVDIVKNTRATLSNGTEVILQGELYIFPSGKAIIQAPAPQSTKAHFVDDWQGESAYLSISVIVGNDPAQDVSSVKFVPNPIAVDPKNPDKVQTFEPIVLTKVNAYPEKGVSTWKAKYTGAISEDMKKNGLAGKLYFGGLSTNTSFAILLQ